MLHKRLFTIAVLLITLVGSSEAASLSNWLKDWHIQLNVSKPTHFSLPAQPTEVFYLQKRITAHTKPINSNEDGIKLSLTADIPLMQTNKYNLGLHSGYERQRTINALEYGGYVSLPAGKLTANAWLGAKTYRLDTYERSSDLLYGCNGVTAMAWGVGARTHSSDDWNWQVSIESAGPVHTNNLTYESQNRTMNPAIGSTSPTLTIDRNTTLLIGLGIDVSLFSTIAAQRRARAELEQQRIKANITPGYMAFSKAFVYNNTGAYRASMDAIKWDAEQQQLIIKVASNYSYDRNATFTDWAKDNHSLENLYPGYEADAFTSLVTRLEQAVKQAQKEGAAVPRRVQVSVEFSSYEMATTTTVTSSHGIPMTITRTDRANEKLHRATIEFMLDPLVQPVVQKQSARTQIDL